LQRYKYFFIVALYGNIAFFQNAAQRAAYAFVAIYLLLSFLFSKIAKTGDFLSCLRLLRHEVYALLPARAFSVHIQQINYSLPTHFNATEICSYRGHRRLFSEI
jgi:hypothetical protein